MCFWPRGGGRTRVAIHIVLGSPAGPSVFQEPSLLPGGPSKDGPPLAEGLPKSVAHMTEARPP